jgi:hypothetical protein
MGEDAPGCNRGDGRPPSRFAGDLDLGGASA